MNRVVSWFSRIFIKPIVTRCFIKEARGLENVPKGNFILASNHQSHLDWIACGWICVPRRFTYLGQSDRYSGLLGLARNILYFIAGVISVNRNESLSKKASLEKMARVIKGGSILVIYPEGTRSRTGKIQEGKTGIAKIYLKTGVPILPVAIRGTFELLPPGGKLKIKKAVAINIGKPLYFPEEMEEAKSLDKDSEEYNKILRIITDRTMGEIIRLYNELGGA